MATVKKTITIPEDLAREAESFSDQNFSAYVAEALQRRVASDRLAAFAAADAADRGAIPQADIDAMRAEMAALDR